MTTCERCGIELQIGDYPFCPHGHGHATVIGDEMDAIIENNGTPHPIRFRSKAALNAHMHAHGLIAKVRHVPQTQESDYSPHTTDWSRGIDPQTLENVRVLLSRRSGGSAELPAPTLPVDLSVRVLDTGIRGTYE